MQTTDGSFIPENYELVRPISEGAFGRVLHIRHKGTKKEFALKLLPTITEIDKKRARREVEQMKRFSHPRIVGFYDSIETEAWHGIIMELGSRNLKDLICEYEERGERIPLDVVVLICNDIVEGLKFMHTHPSGPTAHGDLKPENVLLTVDNRAILCDLGAADEEGVMLSHSAREIGTYEYNSPERLKGDETHATPQSDIWSVGVILHRMLTGCRLFTGSTLWKMSSEITDFTPTELASTIPVEFRDVLIRLLDPKPFLRLQSSQIVDGCLFERMLGPVTPLSRMRGTINQRQTKRIDDLTHCRFESEEEQWGFVPSSLRLIATACPKMLVRRWTESLDGPHFTCNMVQIPFLSSVRIGDLATICDLGKHFLVGRLFLDPMKTFAEEGFIHIAKLSTFPAFEGDPIFIEGTDGYPIPIDTSTLKDDEGLSGIINALSQFMDCQYGDFDLKNDNNDDLDITKSWKENNIEPWSIIRVVFPSDFFTFRLFVKTVTNKRLALQVWRYGRIIDLKRQIEEKEGIPITDQHTLCSELLNQHSSDSAPLLLFLVPAQLHLDPFHTEVTTADMIILDGMTQQKPMFSLPHSLAVDDADLFNSVAGVYTEGRRILYLIWLRHNDEILQHTTSQIWEENRHQITDSLHNWIRHCLLRLDTEHKEKDNLWHSQSLQMTKHKLLSNDPEVQRLDMNETTLRDYFIADVAAHLYTLLPFDITPTDIDGFIEEEEERAHAKPGSDLQCKEKGDNLRMKLMVLQMLAEYETRLPHFGMHLPPQFQTQHYPTQNPQPLSPISAYHDPCPLWDFESVQSLMQNQEEIRAAQEQLIRRLRRTMALLQLSDFQPIISTDGSERVSVSSLLVQTPTNPFTYNILTPDLLQWCVARQAVWQNHTIMERHQPRHAHLVPCHSHCHPIAKIVASGFPIFVTFHHHDRYIPSLTHNRDSSTMDLRGEPRPLVIGGRMQVLTQTYFLCSSPTALSHDFSTIFDPRRFVSFPSHIHGGVT
ncbi:putative Cyclin-dependent kinase 2 [Blattamonas nauphoetae]|uniref:non-specific serine/threonine protein kinase n=1 Tax=Blattamonas nauphoetae TaxID=2049346 RepID=A0ABQ9WT14_9EUKA|nr:putative Cyclin-dependent kinase 2 [Blattamonas nauphoetae]